MIKQGQYYFTENCPFDFVKVVRIDTRWNMMYTTIVRFFDEVSGELRIETVLFDKNGKNGSMKITDQICDYGKHYI